MIPPFGPPGWSSFRMCRSENSEKKKLRKVGKNTKPVQKLLVRLTDCASVDPRHMFLESVDLHTRPLHEKMRSSLLLEKSPHGFFLTCYLLLLLLSVHHASSKRFLVFLWFLLSEGFRDFIL